ncbi:hypothetical protein BCR34DRAFT_577306 [Clohesyomyces aquaticus]|uniref:NmrA-like domain-containing protein n=1 Tax=Clohesyomyces aquaticus TaxID=1231657 RepID=A0A1Y1YKK3_9PLEO|nr:hypothetical protein BCR34DRAFT_577306 [Clohesyomyces aquaticus]
MATPKSHVLIVGATGYIGGSILSKLLQCSSAAELCISALIRRPEQAAKLQSMGVKPVLFGGLDELETCKEVASQYDVVINAASASHDASARAMVEGLHLRQKATGRNAYMIHTSGTSILGDHPYTSQSHKDKIWSDEKDDVFEMEKNHPEWYGQRVTDVSVVESGQWLDVRTYIVVPPTICG